jgi:hypothetical protein
VTCTSDAEKLNFSGSLCVVGHWSSAFQLGQSRFTKLSAS